MPLSSDACGDLLGRAVSDVGWPKARLPRKLGGCDLQSAEAKLASSAWAGLAAATQQAERAYPVGTDVLIGAGVGLPMSMAEAQRLLREWGQSQHHLY